MIIIPNYPQVIEANYPYLPNNCDLPPTLYSILNSIVNYGVEDKTKIKDLAKMGRAKIFDFDYPLSNNVSKETFETLILNKFMMRRIGFDTVTAFKLALNVKLNEIMPEFNILFDSLFNFNLFLDGEVETRELTEAKNKTTSGVSDSTGNTTNTNNTSVTGTDISDRRNSLMPEDKLSEVKNGEYVTEYNYDTNTTDTRNSSSDITDSTKKIVSSGSEVNDNLIQEIIKRSPKDKMTILKEYSKYLNEKNNIYSMIFNRLDVLFYGLL